MRSNMLHPRLHENPTCAFCGLREADYTTKYRSRGRVRDMPICGACAGLPEMKGAYKMVIQQVRENLHLEGQIRRRAPKASEAACGFG